MFSIKKHKMYYLLGYLGELFVIFLLKIQFYKILKHRFSCRIGEVDLIATKNKQLIFIEVKTSLFATEAPISYKQQLNITCVAKHFIALNNKFNDYDIRFDLYFFSLKSGIIHIKNAWGENY